MSRLVASAILLLAISMAASTPLAQPSSSWAKRVDSGNSPETVTNLQFYFHDTSSGKNATVVQIVKPVAPAALANFSFGMLRMTDDLLTVSINASSKVIGRAKGMYGFASPNDLTLIMNMCYVFTDGPYNGSTFNVVGGNPSMDTNRELPVSSGTGLFRMARGYALLRTVWFNTAGDVIVNYNATVYAPASNAAGF